MKVYAKQALRATVEEVQTNEKGNSVGASSGESLKTVEERDVARAPNDLSEERSSSP